MIEPQYGPGYSTGPSDGPKAARIARALWGYELMDWQQWVLDVALERLPDGHYRYRTVVVSVARQNGKSFILRTLLGERLFHPRTVTAVLSHDRAQAREVIYEPVADVFSHDRMAPLLPKIRRSNGFERVLLGALDARLVLLSASERAAHGYSLDTVVVDEAWSLFDHRVPQAVAPTQVHRPNPQLFVVSTAGVEQSTWLRSLVDQGRAGVDGLCYFEWSAPPHLSTADRDGWQAANPSLGQGIGVEALAANYATLPESEFERAHLNRWTVSLDAVIDAEQWARVLDGLAPGDPVVLAFDVALDRSQATIVAAGPAGPGGARTAVEVLDQRAGVDWILPRLVELSERHTVAGIVANGSGPARAIVEQAPAAGVPVESYNATSFVAACQVFFDLTLSGRLAHRGQPALDLAVASSTRRPLSGSWAFGRSHPAADISALVAAAVAAHRASRPHLVPTVVFG